MKSGNRLAATTLGTVILLLLASAAFSPARAQAKPGPKTPNIIFILADDLGYGDLGCYGQTRIKTPHLDKLAAEGMRFTQCYAGSTVCAPSRATLMTGQHTGHTLIRGNAAVALRPQDVTVAEMLKSAGYKTAAIGKWGLGLENTTGVPQKKGFDQWLGYLDQTHAHNYYPEYLWRFDPATGYDGKLPLTKNENNRKGQYAPDLFTAAALNYVRINQPEEASQFTPFFLYLAYTTPHANNESTRATGNGMEVPSDAPYTGERWSQPEKNKAAMITRLDADIGKLLARLDEMQIATNTVIFFSSDNGPHQEGGNDPKFFESQGGLRGIKRDLYEGGIRVPMIVRWPGIVPAGRVSEQVWAFWDFLPTVADIAGGKIPAGIDGISMLTALTGYKQKNHEFLYWEFHEGGSKQAVRMQDWKAVRLAPGQPLELYNLKTDRAELLDVAGENPAVIAQIEAYLKTARTENEHWPLKPSATKKAK